MSLTGKSAEKQQNCTEPVPRGTQSHDEKSSKQNDSRTDQSLLHCLILAKKSSRMKRLSIFLYTLTGRYFPV